MHLCAILAAKRPAERAVVSPSKRPVTKKFTVNGAVLPMARDLYFMLQPDLAQLKAYVGQAHASCCTAPVALARRQRPFMC